MEKYNLSIHNVHLLLKEMLNKIDEVASKTGCIYYLHAGTALGAIRHKDLIPWDDDADIIIPITCYERFISELRKSDLGKFEVIYREPRCTRMQAKMILKGQDEDLVCIDLFPLIGTGQSIKEQSELDKASSHIRRYYKFEHELANSQSTNIFKAIAKKIIAYTMKLWKSDQKLYHMFDEKVLYKYDYETSEYVTQPCGKYGLKNVQEKSVYGAPVKRILGERKYPTPNKIEEYLEHYYGDYMTTPSEESKNKSINKLRPFIGSEKEYLACIHQ